jgi:hypothetical protein
MLFSQRFACAAPDLISNDHPRKQQQTRFRSHASEIKRRAKRCIKHSAPITVHCHLLVAKTAGVRTFSSDDLGLRQHNLAVDCTCQSQQTIPTDCRPAAMKAVSMKSATANRNDDQHHYDAECISRERFDPFLTCRQVDHWWHQILPNFRKYHRSSHSPIFAAFVDSHEECSIIAL